jgi:hypothetical protein
MMRMVGNNIDRRLRLIFGQSGSDHRFANVTGARWVSLCTGL